VEAMRESMGERPPMGNRGGGTGGGRGGGSMPGGARGGGMPEPVELKCKVALAPVGAGDHLSLK
jgi:hypothetical protein